MQRYSIFLHVDQGAPGNDQESSEIIDNPFVIRHVNIHAAGAFADGSRWEYFVRPQNNLAYAAGLYGQSRPPQRGDHRPARINDGAVVDLWPGELYGQQFQYIWLCAHAAAGSGVTYMQGLFDITEVSVDEVKAYLRGELDYRLFL